MTPTNYVSNIVYDLTVTKVATLRNIEVLSDI